MPYRIVLHSIDWVSVQLSAICTLFAFTSNSAIQFWLGIIVMVSTLTYNAIKIIKELRPRRRFRRKL